MPWGPPPPQAEDTDSDSESSGSSMPTLEPIPRDQETDIDPPDVDDPLAAIRSRYVEAEGPPINDEYLKNVSNTIWKESGSAKVMKDLHDKYPRPKGIVAQRVDMNEEVLRIMPKYATSRDAKLRSIQGTIARSVIPVVQASAMLRASKAGPALQGADLDAISTLCMDSVSMLAHANDQTNDFRREIAKPTLKKKYQGLCKLPKEADTSRLLLGDNIADRIKSLKQTETLSSATGKMGRSKFKKRHHPYFQGPQGFAGQYPMFGPPQQYSPYGNYSGFHRQQKGNKPNFLGEFLSQDLHKSDSLQNICLQSETYVRPNLDLSFSRQEQGERSQAVPEVEQESDSDNLEAQHDLDVGTLSIEQTWASFRAGRIKQCYAVWKTLTSDRQILSTIKNGYRLEFCEIPTQDQPAHEIKLKHEEYLFLKEEIALMSSKGIIALSSHETGEYISNIFLREKKTKGKFRFILNLKNLNLSVDKHKFKMDTLAHTLALVTRNAWMVSLDFEDAYYSLAVHQSSRKYLKFQFEGLLYEFTCLPNGLTSAPRIFTKVLKVMLAHMREQMGITITGYLDDQFIIGDSPSQVLQAGNYAARLFQQGGFKINLEKSVLQPTQTLEHLGFIIDSQNMVVRLTPEKIEKLKQLLNDCLEERQMSIRKVATITGKCLATKPANPWAMLFTKQLEIEKIEALAVHDDFDASMTLSEEAMNDLHWWVNNVDSLVSPITAPPYDKVLKTDASLLGWGFVLDGEKTGGHWSPEEQKFHINYLELKAILLSLFSVARDWNNCHVRIRSDNTTAVSSINKQGSTHSKACNDITRQIWEFAVERDIWISAVHIPGTENSEADSASREFKDETEWTLRRDLFEGLCDILGYPDVDLFATRLNYQVKPFAAWKPDPEATMIDSLMHPWGGVSCIYAFPPFSIVHSVIQKFITDRAEGILVVPYWTTKPWFTVFANLIVAKPVLLPVTDNALFLPFNRPGSCPGTRRRMRTHSMAGKLRLIAALCTTDAGKLKDFRMALSERSQMVGENRHRNCTNHTWIDGNVIVSRGVFIPFIHL